MGFRTGRQLIPGQLFHIKVLFSDEVICQQHRPDMVITDYRMPGMSGMDLCRQLRQLPQTANTPVLMITALAFEILPGELAEAGVAAVISKPFSPRDVVRRIGELLDTPDQASA
ncbi:MAG: PleD family two-component system response regulator [Syntrophobacteria bacterium]